jgi:glutamate--cysteine ligase
MPTPRIAAAGAEPCATLSAFERFVAEDGGALLATGHWGLEREVLRIEADGQPARTPHPFPPDEKEISVDFAESQAELVTQPLPDPAAALAQLGRLQRRLQAAIGDELLWPLSLPGRWDAPDRVQAASFAGRPEWDAQRLYRRNLERRHGKARQVISGIHYNFSFSAEFLSRWRTANQSTEPEKALRDAVYFSVMRNFLRHQHVFNALWGVSPPGDEAFWLDLLAHTRPDLRENAVRCREHVSSVRLSPLGYALAPDVERQIGVTFASLDEYRTKIAEAIQPRSPAAPLLAHEREFYSAVRPKPSSAAAAGPAGSASTRGDRFALLDALGREGVGYLEFRVFDLDPFEPVGIGMEALRFFHLFVLANLFLPSPLISPGERLRVTDRNRWSTLCGSSLREEPCRPGPDERSSAEAVFSAMATIAPHLPPPYSQALTAAREKWAGRVPRPIDRLRAALASGPGTTLEFGLDLARRHRETLAHEP